MKQYITTENVSRGRLKKRLCIRYTQSVANAQISVDTISNPALIIVPQMKKSVYVGILMISSSVLARNSPTVGEAFGEEGG